MTTRTWPLWIARRPGGQIRQVPWMATGRTGTWLVTAMMKAPSLKSPIVPSGEAVPSG